MRENIAKWVIRSWSTGVWIEFVTVGLPWELHGYGHAKSYYLQACMN